MRSIENQSHEKRQHHTSATNREKQHETETKSKIRIDLVNDGNRFVPSSGLRRRIHTKMNHLFFYELSSFD